LKKQLTFGLATGALVAAMLPGATLAVDDQRQTFVITQAAPFLVEVDVGLPGQSHGDMLAFEAAVSDEEGRTGVLRGLLITVDQPDESGDPFEDRIGQLVFDMGGGDSLVVAGGSIYSGAETEMLPDAPQLRAVVGGTDKWIGARGQVETTRNADGSYQHVFTLLD
jgi:hypothetical protein